ncbi:MAG: hypothetical protein Q8M09_07425 [Pseudomonadota bacterium]|nr:hypothetical protein [Pseudomonadota bacterium]MDP2351050.1 hypothetical protein [Pseudomonadota bacterium]
MNNSDKSGSAVYVVLGMHKSGTTLVSRLMSASGIDMGERDQGTDYDDGDHVERPETKEINKALLECGNLHSNRVRNKPTILAMETNKEKGKMVVEEMLARSPVVGFKDPRTCLTYAFWQEALPLQHKLIVVIREPWETWVHYTKNNKGNSVLFKMRGVLTGLLALRAWYKYNSEICKILETSPASNLLLNYRELMTNDAELKRLECFVNKEIPDLRDKSRYRSKSGKTLGYKIASKVVLIVFGENLELLLNKMNAKNPKTTL